MSRSCFLWSMTATLGCGLGGFGQTLSLKHGASPMASTFVSALVMTLLAGAAGGGADAFQVDQARVWSAIAGVFSFVGVAACLAALKHGPASVVSPFVSVYCLVTTVLAIAFLGERPSALQITGAACVCIGAILLTR